jgi:hypothetical protein
MATDSLRTLIDAAKTAIAAADYATAQNKLLQAELELVVTPDSKMSAEEMTWGRDAIAALQTRLAKLNTAATGLQFIKVQRVSPTDN